MRQIREAYANADCFLRVAPGLTVTAFRQMRDVGPIAEPSGPNATLPSSRGSDTIRKVILVGFGGIALQNSSV